MSHAPKTIVTHDGAFHADDVFGVAVLDIVFPGSTILRTRSTAVIDRADFVVDVGSVSDPARGRFDHHQKSFDGARPTVDDAGNVIRGQAGIGYASAGLVWAVHGVACVHSMAKIHVCDGTIVSDDVVAMSKEIDDEWIRYIDLVDNGMSPVAPDLFGFSALLSQLNANWIDEAGAEDIAALHDMRFSEAVVLVQNLLASVIHNKVAVRAARQAVRESRTWFEGRLLVLDKGMPWGDVVRAEMPDVLFVIYPVSRDGEHHIHTVAIAPGSFVSRALLPVHWAGFRDADLVERSGVPDAVFCHTNAFIGGAKSLQGALQMGQAALGALLGRPGL